MKTTAPLRTSAMIASFADECQRTTPAPFGHALVAAAQTGGGRAVVKIDPSA